MDQLKGKVSKLETTKNTNNEDTNETNNHHHHSIQKRASPTRESCQSASLFCAFYYP